MRRGEIRRDHGVVGGRSAELSAGIRRFLTAQNGFTPYASVRLGIRAISFSNDDVRGVAALAIAGAGVRVRLHELVSLGGGAALEVGGGLFGRGLGGELQLGLSIFSGVEFLLR